jgi:hypothetical protein
MSDRLKHAGGGSRLAERLAHGGEANRLWVVEYSGTQKAFHIETLAEALRSNREQFAAGGMVDYVPLAVVSSHGEASALCDRMENLHGRPGTAQEAYDQRAGNFNRNSTH